jgi:hypothetical protein
VRDARRMERQSLALVAGAAKRLRRQLEIWHQNEQTLHSLVMLRDAIVLQRFAVAAVWDAEPRPMPGELSAAKTALMVELTEELLRESSLT